MKLPPRYRMIRSVTRNPEDPPDVDVVTVDFGNNGVPYRRFWTACRAAYSLAQKGGVDVLVQQATNDGSGWITRAAFAPGRVGPEYTPSIDDTIR